MGNINVKVDEFNTLNEKKIVILGSSGSGKSLLYNQIVKYFTGYDKIFFNILYDIIEVSFSKIMNLLNTTVNNDSAYKDYLYLSSLLDKKIKDFDINYILHICHKYNSQFSINYMSCVDENKLRIEKMQNKNNMLSICDVGNIYYSREEWINYFKNTNIVIYVIPLDPTLSEEEIERYNLTINGEVFKKKKFFLIFSKEDLLLCNEKQLKEFINSFQLYNHEGIKLKGNLYDFSFIKQITTEIEK